MHTLPDLISELTLSDIQTLITRLGEPAYRAKQLCQWIYQRNALTYDAMSNLPKPLRHQVSLEYDVCSLQLEHTVEAPDGSARKYLFRTRDNHLIEGVAIVHGKRYTLCISSQIGCAFNCAYCASGASGLIRDLCAGEIIDQIRLMTQDRTMTNLVFMGAGEALQNFPAFAQAYEIIHAEWGLELGQRKITVSTVGYVPGIKMLITSPLRPILALSLHTLRDDIRSQLMPINKKYPIQEVLDVCWDYSQASGRAITIEYMLIPELNMSDHDIARLHQRFCKYPAKINLIPLNAVERSTFRAPTEDEVYDFFHKLKDTGLDVTIRWSKGASIAAACGQLKAQRSE